jgi:hypothetical protein
MRSQMIEQYLTRQGVKWLYLPEVLLEDINTQRGLQMQARTEEPILEDIAERYKGRYLAGEEAPPLVLYRPGKTKYTPLDGNQRIEACKRARKKVHDAYLVECEDMSVLQRICWGINQHIHGQPLKYSEAIAHAITYVRRDGWTCRQAAEEYGCNEKTLMKEVRCLELKDQAEAAGAKRVPSKDVLNNLAGVAKLGDDLFKDACEAMADTGGNAKDALDLGRKVRGARTSMAKKIAIAEFAASDRMQSRKAETKGGRVRTNRKKLVRERHGSLVRQILDLLKDNKGDKVALLPGSKVEQATERELVLAVIEQWTLLYGLGVLPDRAGSRKEAQ